MDRITAGRGCQLADSGLRRGSEFSFALAQDQSNQVIGNFSRRFA